jgi:hypothetical protein
MDDNDIFQANKKSTDRLRKLIANISEKELSIKVGGEWNILLTLAHIAFWDQRSLYVLESAKKNNKLYAPYFDDQLNDILPPILSLIPPQIILKYTISVSEKLDTELENCTKDLLKEIKEVNNRLLDRSIHRNLHLDEIESVLRSEEKIPCHLI